jgi:hypothetical protein
MQTKCSPLMWHKGRPASANHMSKHSSIFQPRTKPGRVLWQSSELCKIGGALLQVCITALQCTMHLFKLPHSGPWEKFIPTKLKQQSLNLMHATTKSSPPHSLLLTGKRALLHSPPAPVCQHGRLLQHSVRLSKCALPWGCSSESLCTCTKQCR